MSAGRDLRMAAGPSRAGFSLVEVLCAMTILGIGVAGISEGITLALRLSKESERHTVASRLAASRIEALRVEGYLTEGEDEGDFDDFPQYSWRQTIAKAGIDGLYRVAVAVDLADTQEQVLEIETLLFEAPYSDTYGTTGAGKAAGTGTGSGRYRGAAGKSAAPREGGRP